MIFSSVSETKASSPVIGTALLKYYLEFIVFFRPIKKTREYLKVDLMSSGGDIHRKLNFLSC